MVSADTVRRSGTTLEVMPPERRRTAFVRAVTGRLSTTSSRPVIWARYAAKAAMTAVATVVSSRSRNASIRAAVPSESAALSIRLSGAGGADRPARLVGSSTPATRSSQ
ncbi:hypothetical protein RE9431_36630 [Prescottella equi]|nr:hypothetical protein RE9427_36560 [Prescottella equi]BCN65208.1 hypothetical protein RE9431_36630 [Prescottella equi]BCN70119.1 hypothetical protein RE943_35920 [Prescottella equi]BCN85039.1 hypothetical protein RE0356_36800 [Prescottella equi]